MRRSQACNVFRKYLPQIRIFFSEAPERRIFEVEFTVKITDYEETAKEKLFPESFFLQAYFLNSESEEIKIMGTPIENSKTEQKDTVKIRYAFDMGESPAEDFT